MPCRIEFQLKTVLRRLAEWREKEQSLRRFHLAEVSLGSCEGAEYNKELDSFRSTP